jgi:transposase
MKRGGVIRLLFIQHLIPLVGFPASLMLSEDTRMKAGRPIPSLLLTAHESEALRAWTRQPKCPQALALRARLILLCAAGHSNTEVAADLHVTVQTVGKWRQRFIDKRLDGLLDEPRPGTPRRLSVADVDRVLGLTLDSSPAHSEKWSTRSLAEASGLSRASVHRIWRAFSLQPHRAEAFKLLKQSLHVEKGAVDVGGT